MALYRFVNKKGEFEDIEYTKQFSPNEIDDVLCGTWKSLNSCFPLYSFDIEKKENYIYKASIHGDGVENSFSDIDILYMLTTPGGRDNLTYEQRIQPTGDALRCIYNKDKAGHIAVLIGLYSFNGAEVFCAWTVSNSVATGTSSKQIKIGTIQAAVRNGFALQEKTKNTDYACAFRPEFLMFYLSNYKCIHRNDLISLKTETIGIVVDESVRLEGGQNILLYGVPGSGKSWTIEHEYCSSSSVVDRLVFHPDYTNADFVGQILPVVDSDKQVTYEFVPGPFTTILREAYRNPKQEYVLIIEEINRGNAPAIFGDVFQLLDRSVSEKIVDGITYKKGTSEYAITNENIADQVYGDKSHKVRIPSNLSIIGTMNTSDQNVFTLDTAFQRRWQMRLIENNFDCVRDSLANAEILDTRVTWKKFCETVNGIIVGNKAKMASAEDKRLGVYFIHEESVSFDAEATHSEGYDSLLDEHNALIKREREGSITESQKIRLATIRKALLHNRMFPEKVLKYLWDDAFKFNPEALFDTGKMDSLEKVIRTFVYAEGTDRFKILNKTVRDSLYLAQ